MEPKTPDAREGASEATASARALLEAAVAAVVRGSSLEARRIAAATAVLAEACDAHAAAADAHAFIARLDHAATDFEGARASFARAAEAQRRAGDEVARLRMHLSVAFVHYDEGDGGQALAILDEVEAQRRSIGPLAATLQPRLHGYRGNIARQRGALAEARGHYHQAIAAAVLVQEKLFAHVFTMDDAVTRLLHGDDAGGLGQLMELLQASQQQEPPEAPPGGQQLQWVYARSIVEHYVTIARLLVGVAGTVDPDAPVLPSLRGVHDVITRIHPATTLGALQKLSHRTEHARLSARLLLRLTETSSPHPRVLISRDGTKLLRGSRVIDLARRPSLRRILAALAIAAADGAGPLPTATLIDAGWPEEKMLASAARNRLHVALNTLRKLGLDIALRQTAGGYELDPACSVVVGAVD